MDFWYHVFHQTDAGHDIPQHGTGHTVSDVLPQALSSMHCCGCIPELGNCNPVAQHPSPPSLVPNTRGSPPLPRTSLNPRPRPRPAPKALSLSSSCTHLRHARQVEQQLHRRLDAPRRVVRQVGVRQRPAQRHQVGCQPQHAAAVGEDKQGGAGKASVKGGIHLSWGVPGQEPNAGSRRSQHAAAARGTPDGGSNEAAVQMSVRKHVYCSVTLHGQGQPKVPSFDMQHAKSLHVSAPYAIPQASPRPRPFLTRPRPALTPPRWP